MLEPNKFKDFPASEDVYQPGKSLHTEHQLVSWVANMSRNCKNSGVPITGMYVPCNSFSQVLTSYKNKFLCRFDTYHYKMMLQAV